MGNYKAGQDARSVGFIAAAIKILDAVKVCEEAKNDVRAEAALQAAMKEAFDATENLPEFDKDLVEGGAARFAKLGVSTDGILAEIGAAELEA
ncbi:hypothetical protein AB4Y36_22135 [Paraburkholderia sp. BR10936]|uniref:hypothetical protein n=1 Tax=Paraburkholderia sp. BR10936 TaxID=3236993 RepID=UPI0034D23395